jgi:hypothetical protein
VFRTCIWNLFTKVPLSLFKTVIGEQYFQALKLISAVRAMPGFSHLPAESLGLDNPISQPPPLLYK